MEKLVRCQVVLRPTNDKTGIIRHNTYSGQWYLPNQVAPNHPEILKYHMDIVCNQFPVLPEDWVLVSNLQDPVFIESLEHAIDIENPDNLGRIIATTDGRLSLPRISQDFIERFVRCSGGIFEVLVKYNITFTCTKEFKNRPCIKDIEQPISCGHCVYLDKRFIPLVKFNNRGFVLEPYLIKDSWSKVEVVDLVKKAFEAGMMYGGNVEEWIETNIKDYAKE